MMKTWKENHYVFEEKEAIKKLGAEGDNIILIEQFKDRRIKVITK